MHGSALGQQGLSQVLVTSTIGDDGSAAKSEGITGETRQQLMVQLNTRVAAATEVQPCNPPPPPPLCYTHLSGTPSSPLPATPAVYVVPFLLCMPEILLYFVVLCVIGLESALVQTAH